MKNFNDIIRNNKVIVYLSLFLLVIMLRGGYLALSTNVNGINLKEFSEIRSITRQVLPANRGTIYDRNGEILAIDVSSYTVIAYLEEARTDNPDNPHHVTDKRATAKALAEVLSGDEETIFNLLSKEGQYQVELGSIGRGITELKKEEIEELNLPGIDFMPSYKRYYPNGIFASYLLGYAKTDENGDIIGEFGIEMQYDDILRGTNGYKEFQRDTKGYQIPDTPFIEEKPVNGNDIYLTIDSNIQIFIEKALAASYNNYSSEWVHMTVADAKTGEILGSGAYPSYNPNKRDIEIYLDPLISYSYEPGSTMKIWTYMAVMENNMYNDDATFLSGTKLYNSGDIIRDWNEGKGWGRITYNEGFLRSSNVGVANLTEKYINSKDLKDYYMSLGFGSKTGINLPREYSGSLNFEYTFDTASAGYGQAITTTPLQNIKALTSISNNGELLNPYIISSIINPANDEALYSGEPISLGIVAEQSTITKIKELMYDAVHSDIGTGKSYKIDGYEILGKTGTAQIAKENGGGYYNSSYGNIFSFAAMFPKDDPEVIIYTSVKRPTVGKTAILEPFKDVVTNVATYLNVFPEASEKLDITYYDMPSLINKDIFEVSSILDNPVIVIGGGDKVIKQYPEIKTNVSSCEKIFVLTNGDQINMINLKNWSYSSARAFCDILLLNCTYDGDGYVSFQSISPGAQLTSESNLILEFNSIME